MSEVNICRACLTDNMYKVYRLKSISCRNFYEKLVISKFEDGLPETFCYICYALLRKCMKFSKMTQRSQLLLSKLKNGGNKINKTTLSKLDKPKLTYGVIKHSLISIEDDTFPESDIHIKKESSYYEEYLDEDIFMDESNNDKNDNINIEYNNDKTDDINIKVGYGDNLNPFTQQTCAVWITEDKNDYNNDINDEDDGLNHLTEEPCAVWIEEDKNNMNNVRKDDKTNNGNDKPYDKNDKTYDRNHKTYSRKDKTYDINNKTNDRNDKTNDTNDKTNGVNDKINDSKDVKFFKEKPCSIWITKDRNRKYYIRNDGYNKAKEKISDGDEVSLFMEKPRHIWIPEDVPIQKPELKKEEEPIKDPIKLNLKCYQNKRKVKETTNNVNVNSDKSQPYKVANPMKAYYENIKLSLSQNDISGHDKSEEPILSSDNNISKNDKTVISLHEEAKSLSRDEEPSLNLIDLSPYDSVKMDKKELGYYHCSACDYQCLMLDTFKQHIEACKIKYELMMKSDISDPFSVCVGYACSSCDFKTLSLPQFNFHKNNHTHLSLYYCKKCDYRTSSQYKLKIHLKNQHKAVNFATLRGLHNQEQNHKIVTKKNEFTCDICQYTCNTQTHITKHLKTHVDKKQYSCIECNFTCYCPSMLKDHTKYTHRLIPCKDCQFRCNTKKELYFHKREAHEKKPIHTCNICDFKCALEKHMKSHIWLRHEGAYKCYKCDFQSTKKKVLKTHLLSEHNEAKLYSCEKCNYKTDERGSLKQHSKVHTDEGYICNVCKFKTKFKSNLIFHIKTQHTQIEKNLLCHYCGMTFKTRFGLKTHLLIHVGSRTVSCTVCEFKCFKSSVLKRHMLKHSGEKPFVCDLCGRRFTRRSNLNHHRGKLACRHSNELLQ